MDQRPVNLDSSVPGAIAAAITTRRPELVKMWLPDGPIEPEVVRGLAETICQLLDENQELAERLNCADRRARQLGAQIQGLDIMVQRIETFTGPQFDSLDQSPAEVFDAQTS